MKINYQKELDATLRRIDDRGVAPTLLLHSCCAPCSSYVLEYLSKYFFICVYYYNPNIAPSAEYERRKSEQARLIERMPTERPVSFLQAPYDPDSFFAMAKGMELLAEGGERCRRCYRMRLERTAKAAKENGFDYFTTTLSISPLKDAQTLNAIGKELAQVYGVEYLCSDFKKREGYKRSIELSKIYDLYRQDYCGCRFSKAQRQREVSDKSHREG